MWTLYEDLDTVVEIRRELFDGGGYLDFIDILPDAWREIIPDRERVFNEVVHADLARLRRAGVAGWSLTAKLEAWNSARERMLDEFDIGGPEITTSPAIPPPPPPSPPPPPGFADRFVRWLSRRRPLRRKRALHG